MNVSMFHKFRDSIDSVLVFQIVISFANCLVFSFSEIYSNSVGFETIVLLFPAGRSERKGELQGSKRNSGEI